MANQEKSTVDKHLNFTVGDEVNTPYGIGIVWKVTETSVHVRHPFNDGWLYSKYLTTPKHHSQKPISVLSHCNQ